VLSTWEGQTMSRQEQGISIILGQLYYIIHSIMLLKDRGHLYQSRLDKKYFYSLFRPIWSKRYAISQLDFVLYVNSQSLGKKGLLA